MKPLKLQTLFFTHSKVNQEWIIFFEKEIQKKYTYRELESYIESEYKSNKTNHDGYSKLAYFLLTQDQNLEYALSLFTKDYEEKRQSWFQTLRYAECLAKINKFDLAESKIRKIYDLHSEACNGYASIAWSLRNSNLLPSSAYEYASRDLKQQRSSPGYLLNIATLAIQANKIAEALELVNQAYLQDPSLKNGYSRCGQELFKLNKNSQQLQLYFEKDQQLNRLSFEYEEKLKRLKAPNIFVESSYPSYISSNKSSRKKISLTVSFPRSGSNWLQNVITETFDQKCSSMYASPCFNKPIFNLKSHAINEQNLEKETLSLLHDSPNNLKKVILFRDPRDIIISFYEFVKARDQVLISQEDFLKLDYNHATFGGNAFFFKKSSYDTISLSEAYKIYVDCWFKGNIQNSLFVKYEDLLSEPDLKFNEVFEFLELDTEKQLVSLNKHVSIKDKSNRPRCQSSAWKQVYSKYKVLIDAIEKDHSSELDLLKYN